MERLPSFFVRRCMFLVAIQAFLVLCLIVRMFYLQVIEGNHYRLLAEGNRVATKFNLPLRGQIYDRNDVPLAINETTFRAILIGNDMQEMKDSLESLSQFIDLGYKEREKLVKNFKTKKFLGTLVIKESLTWEELSMIEMHLDDLPGISIEVGYKRSYPFKEVGAHLLGYVAAASENEIQDEDIFSIPGLRIGKNGLEKYYEKSLRGVPGQDQLEINAHRRIIRMLSHIPSHSGKEIKLTIDAKLQDYIQQSLSAYESGSAVVLDIQTGEVLALVSSPSYDPNLFPNGIREKEWRRLMDNPYVPLTNKAISGLYAPGSTMKMLVSLAALKAGIIDEKTTIFCPGHTYLGDHKFHCWRKQGHGPVNVEQAITQSCDVFFYEISKRLGIDPIAETYREFGLGNLIFDHFPQEKKGLVPDKVWKKEKKGSSWRVSDTILVSIGQSYMLASPLQLAVVAARLGSKGKKVIPTLVKPETPRVFESLNFNANHLSLVEEGMNKVTNDPQGTAFVWRIQDPSLSMAGKTGTSQVRRITMQQRLAGQTKTHHLPWKYREHGLFIGYAPVHDPRFAIAVVIEHSGGASPATQVARDILIQTQKICGGILKQ